MDKKVLEELGLTHNEADIFIVVLRNGAISAYDIAKKTGWYRQAVYDTLNRLIEKGFVNSISQGKAQLYQAIDPALILEFLNEKTEQFKNILPELVQLRSQAKNNLFVETYRGNNVTRISLRDIVNQLKKSGGEVLCTAVDETISLSQHRSTIEQYERDLIRYGIKERVILEEGKTGIFKKGNSTYRTIPHKYFNSNPIQIYGDNVQIIIWGNPDYLIIIRSKDVAEPYRKQFELLWKIAGVKGLL